jgi:hypothetical protein
MTVWHDRASWTNKEPKSRSKFKTKPLGLALHWEGVTTEQGGLDSSKATLRAIQRSHLANKAEGYIDIAYNFAVDHLGNVFELRGWDVQGAANGTTAANETYISVCYLTGPGQPFTDAAKQAFKSIRSEADKRGIGSENKPHSAFKATACPGDEIRTFLKTLGSAPAPANQASTPSLPSWGGFPLPKGHYFGTLKKNDDKNHSGFYNERDRQFIKLIQREVSVPDDGLFGGQTEGAVINYQKARGLPANGLFDETCWNRK